MQPILFQIGSLNVSGYFFFRMVGFVIALVVLLYFAARSRLPFVETAAFALFGVAAAVLGGKIFSMGLHIVRQLIAGDRAFAGVLGAARGGGSFFGVIAGGLLFSFWYLPRFKLPGFAVGDAAAPALALGHSIQKIGCFCAGCCLGEKTELPWAVIFPGGSAARHPLQIYEAAAYLLLFVGLALLWRRRKFNGRILSVCVACYGLIQFATDYVRDEAGIFYLMKGHSPLSSLTFRQAVALAALGVGIFLYGRGRRLSRSAEAGTSPEPLL
jgi:phosphatidylglycerol:prolipoprotein diacylglycerol transferase